MVDETEEVKKLAQGSSLGNRLTHGIAAQWMLRDENVDLSDSKVCPVEVQPILPIFGVFSLLRANM